MNFLRKWSLSKSILLGCLVGLCSVLSANGIAQKNETQKIDPDLSIGTLPNGMRYYIKVNKTPAKRAQLWLAVNAGSVQEDDDQRGFAHFMEHMAFNGTKNFPGNSLIDFVESAGMQFGADLNAYTSFDETVYMLTIPTDSDTLLRQGMQILEDWAGGGVTIDSSEVLAERGVVLGEWRSRMMDTASENYMRQQQGALYGKTSRYLQRFPIGDPTLIANAQPGPLRRFYKDWYRPDLMAVVIVGDFDKDKMEREVQERFGKIPAVKNPRKRIPANVVVNATLSVNVYRGPVNPSVSVVWPIRESLHPQTDESVFRKIVLDDLLLQYLQRTFLRMREREKRPFYGAQIERIALNRPLGEAYFLNVVAWPDSMESGLTAALTEIERIAQHGIPNAILEQQKAVLLRKLEHAADAESANTSTSLASAYVQHYLRGRGSLMSADQELALARLVLPSITGQTFAQIVKQWRSVPSRKVLYDIPSWAHVRIPTADDINVIFANVVSASIDSQTVLSATSSSPLLTTLPDPGTVVAERLHATSGVTEWTLSNGARVLYKPTNFNPDELFIHAKSMGGTSLLPDSLAFSPGRLVDVMMTAAGGLGESNRNQLQDRLSKTALSEFRVSINYTNEEIALGGSPKELEMLFQLMYLQFTAPKLDTAALAAWKRYGAQTLTQSMNDQIAQILARGNPRLAPPSAALVELVTLEEAMAVYKDRFGDAGDFTFTIVGAADPATVKPLVERYIASLPSLHRKERERPKDERLRPWNEIAREKRRVFPVPKTSIAFLWDGLFPSTPNEYLQARQRLNTVTWVARRRLREELRERLGGTYGVSVEPVLYSNPQEHYQMSINFDAAPERADTLVGVLLQQLDSIRMVGATTEELRKISTIQRRAFETNLASNRYWISMIQEYDRLGIPFDDITKPYTSIMTPAEVSMAAKQFMPTSAYIHLTYLPKDSIDVTLSEKDLMENSSKSRIQLQPGIQVLFDVYTERYK